MKKYLSFAAILMGLVLTSCSILPSSSSSNSIGDTSNSSKDITSSIEEPTSSSNSTSSSAQDEGYDQQEQDAINAFNEKYSFEDLFSINNKIKFNIDMDKDELIRLSNDYDSYPHHSSPIYRKCNLTITINDDSLTLKNVGIRLKGNTSRQKFVDENGNIYALVHFKLAFDKIFDDINYSKDEETRIDDRKICGLKKIDLKWNRNLDATYVREYVAHHLYQEQGIKAAEFGYTNVVLNNTNLGLYFSYECFNKQYLKRQYAKDDRKGDLYKMCYTVTGPANFTNITTGYNGNTGVEDENYNNKQGYFPSYDLKTNEDTSSHENLTNLVKVLNSASSISEIEEIVDLDEFITYEAVSWILGDPDDFRNNANNTYGYFLNNNKLILLPYDKDRTLGTMETWAPESSGMIDVRPLSKRMIGKNQNYQDNPLYNKVLLDPLNNDLTYQNKYLKKINDIFTNSSILSSYKDVYEKVKSNYQDIIKPDNNLSYIDFSLDKVNNNLKIEDYLSGKLNKYKAEN